jgi:hypothetical protein
VQKRSLFNYLLIVLSAEKAVQHAIVTLSFLYNLGNIRSTVAVDYRALTISGAVIAVLFAVSLWALFRGKRWSLFLVAFLAASDVIGEFVAQGTFLIEVTVSIVVAAALLSLCYLENRNLQKTKISKS